MTVRADLAALTAAIDAAVARDASPLQSGDIMTWDPIRQLLLDMAETYYDAGVMRGVVLADDVITSAMIGDDTIETANIGDDQITLPLMASRSVGGNQLVVTGSESVGASVRAALLGLPQGGKLSIILGTEGILPDNRIPATIARDAEVTSAIADALQAAVTDNTETGISVTYAAGKLNFVVSGQGGTPTPTRSAAIYSAITTAVRRPTASDFTTDATGNREASGNTIQMEGWTGNRQLHIAIPADEADLTAIRLTDDPLNQNYIGASGITFAKRTDGNLTIGADGAHKIWSTHTLVASTLFAASGDASPTWRVEQ